MRLSVTSTLAILGTLSSLVVGTNAALKGVFAHYLVSIVIPSNTMLYYPSTYLCDTATDSRSVAWAAPTKP